MIISRNRKIIMFKAANLMFKAANLFQNNLLQVPTEMKNLKA